MDASSQTNPRCSKCNSELVKVDGMWSCPTCRKSMRSSLSDLKREKTITPTTPDVRPKKSKVAIIIIFLVVGTLIGMIGAGVYLFLFSGGIVDGTVTSEEYKFKIVGLYGWEEIYPVEDAYMSFATVDENGIIVSYADIRPVIKEFIGKSDLEIKQEIEDICQDVIVEESETTEYSFHEVTINSISGYQCKATTKALQTHEVTVIILTTLISPDSHPYDYAISTSYPEGYSEERTKVENFINGFYLLD